MTRTERRWISDRRRALRILGRGYFGLISRTSKRGDRRPKISEQTRSLISKFIEERYENVRRPRASAVYAELVSQCQSDGVQAPSFKTFAKAIRLRKQALATRDGPKAAYASRLEARLEESIFARHGDFPFELGHIDHTQLEIELRHSGDGCNLGRPWLSLLIDAYSRRVLAAWLCYDPPSYRSCMMLIRICVQRFGRLPNTIIVDNGKEFGSVYFETLLGCFSIAKRSRPPAKPRFGSVVERLFGTGQTQFIHNLVGNTQLMRNPRQVTKSVNPKNLAAWNLPDLYKRLGEYFYEVYDRNEHSGLRTTPENKFLSGLRACGQRPEANIEYNETFRILTLPGTPKGTARIQPRDGVRINSHYYWTEAFNDPTLEDRTDIEVRYEPFDARIAYAFVHGKWVLCRANLCEELEEYSEKACQLALAEYKQRATMSGRRRRSSSVPRLGAFIDEVGNEEQVLLQRLKDAEMRSVLAYLGTEAKSGVPGPVCSTRPFDGSSEEVSVKNGNGSQNTGPASHAEIEAENDENDFEIYGALQ